MKINILCEDGIVAATKITLEDGTPVHGVEAVHIDIVGRESFVRANVKFSLPRVEFKNLPVSISEEHLRELADAHGFDLVKRG